MLTVLAIAIILIGASYAMWFKVLTINGTINTGYVDAIFTNIDTYDNEPDVKDVSNVTVSLSDDQESMTITVNNAYPCINYTVEFDILNSGTIPVIITDVQGLPDDCYDVNGNLTDAIGLQLEPGDTVHVFLVIHLSNQCEQNSTYTFTITVVAVQWNEADLYVS